MNGQVYQCIYSLLICAGISSVILFLCPENRCKALIETGCTCVMFIMLLTPFFCVDFDEYMTAFTDYCHELKVQQVQFELSEEEFHKMLIEKKFAEYIMNEAKLNGVDLESVKVITTETDDGTILPLEIEYQSDSQIPQNFITYIECTLGVSSERQKVNENTSDNSKPIE